MRITCAAEAVESALDGLSPSKKFLNLDEIDIREQAAYGTHESFDADEFIDNYRWLLYNLHRLKNAKLCIVPILSTSPLAETMNNRPSALSAETGCTFINLTLTDDRSNFDCHV